MSNATGYIVYQSGCVVFGTGTTLADAINDAQQWVDPKGSLVPDGIQKGGYREEHGRMYHSPATQRLMDEAAGGHPDVAFSHREDGVADIDED